MARLHATALIDTNRLSLLPFPLVAGKCTSVPPFVRLLRKMRGTSRWTAQTIPSRPRSANSGRLNPTAESKLYQLESRSPQMTGASRLVRSRFYVFVRDSLFISRPEHTHTRHQNAQHSDVKSLCYDYYWRRNLCCCPMIVVLSVASGLCSETRMMSLCVVVAAAGVQRRWERTFLTSVRSR